jgi:plastocyanin
MSDRRVRVLITILAALAVSSIIFAACSRPGTITSSTASSGTSTPSSSGGGGTGANGCANGTVHMGPTTFLQSCANVTKGSTLNLVDDGQYVHILVNGSWVNSNAQPAKEPGAPTVNNLMFNGNSSSIGPFNTAGTFHIYCSVHVNMNLTVNVK